jgi:FAD/FMN-containing dehydrogenase
MTVSPADTRGPLEIGDDLAPIAVRDGHTDYPTARATFAVTGSPDVVLRATTPDHVAAGIRLAVDSGRPLSIRSGGHHAFGYGTNDGGVVVDLGGMADVEVLDAEARLVRLGAGATWGAVATALAPHGLALTSGDTTSVGVGGLALAGGIGWMVRKHGLTLDLIRAADVVTVDGRVLRASADEHPDLFWAVRGGGGNVGVVTHLELEAAPVSRVVAGMVSFPPDDVPGLLRGYRDAMRAAPEELSTAMLLMPGFAEWPAAVSVFCCWAGDDEEAAAAAIAPIRALAEPTADTVALQPYADILEEAHPPPGVRGLVSNALFDDLDDRALDAAAERYAGGAGGAVVFVRWLSGALNRVPADATAWGHRGIEAMVAHAAFVPVDADDATVEAVVAPGRAIDALGVGAYAGFLGIPGAETVTRLYPPDTLARLRRVKRDYDPDNVLRLNFNVEPA